MKTRRVLYGLAVALLALVATVISCAPTPVVVEKEVVVEKPVVETVVVEKEVVVEKPVVETVVVEKEVVVTPTPAPPSTLVVAVTGDIESLDVHQLAAPRSWALCRTIYGQGFEWGLWTDPAIGLTYATPDFRPGLIESWERKEEAGELVYTLHLRKGCKFASGNELTAKDYVYRTARMEELRPWNNTVWGCSKGADCIKVLDDYTLEWHLDQPNAVSDRGLEELTMMIVDSEELKKHHTDEDPWAHEYLRTHDLGVGAYRIDHMTPGVETLLVKNEDYCAPEYMQGYFDRILIKIIPSVSDQMLLLKKGEIDIAPELPIKEALDLMGEPGVKVLSFDSMNLFRLNFNVHVEPFDNVKVRQALAYAVPYDDIVNAVFLGQAQKPGGLITTGTLGATDKYWVYEYDLDKAKALLAEAGYAEGFDTDLGFDLSIPTHEDTAVLLKDSFAKIGVNVNLIKEDPAAFHEKLYKKEAPPAFLDEMLSWTNDAGYSFDMIFSSWGFANYGDWVNPEMEQIIKDAWLITDPEVRLPMYDRAQEILDTELPVIALCQPNYVVAMREDIEGYIKFWDEIPRYNRLHRAE